jgi:hypothetical protein
MSPAKGLALNLQGATAMTTATTSTQRKSSMLATGTLVRFSVVPSGSYLTAGRTYRVIGTDRRAIHFWDDLRQCGTFDERWAVDRAEFTILS